jgi:pyruvate dehydrogenase complex dehydrogenase (E1) component
MLSLDQKLAVFGEFDELKKESISYERINFKYPDSKKRKQVIARELHQSGNGYVYGGYIKRFKTDSRGWVNIKYFTEDELRNIIREAIGSFSRP